MNYDHSLRTLRLIRVGIATGPYDILSNNYKVNKAPLIMP